MAGSQCPFQGGQGRPDLGHQPESAIGRLHAPAVADEQRIAEHGPQTR